MEHQEQWKLKKEIDLSHVVTMFAFIFGGFWFFADLDKNISNNTQAIESIKEQRNEDRTRFEKRLDSIDDKLDRLIEKN